MPETLLSPSNIHLFGREMNDLRVGANQPPNSPAPNEHNPLGGILDDAGATPTQGGVNNHLANQLASPQIRLARIYCFSYEGHIYDLARPCIMLVDGPGVSVADVRPQGSTGPLPPTGPNKASQNPVAVDATGTPVGPAPTGNFADDMRMWGYDKNDISMRLDTETGPLEKILLEAEMSASKLGLTFGDEWSRVRRNRGGSVGD